MYKTIHIFTGAGRDNFLRVNWTLPRYGFEFASSKSFETKAGLQVTVVAKHCAGDELHALEEFVKTLPNGSRIIVDDKHAFH
jgi:hypothetical protein